MPSAIPLAADDQPAQPSLSPADVPWPLASFLQERADCRRYPADMDRGRRRLAMWTSVPPFDSDDLDAALAPLLGLRADDLVRLLGESPDSVIARAGTPPEWFTRFADAWRQAGKAGQHSHFPTPLGLLEIARPLIIAAHDRLHDRLRAIDLPEELATLPHALCTTLPVAEIAMAVARTTVLELNVARLEGRLAGESAEERFAEFVATLEDSDAALRIWQEYPVLARYLVTVLDAWTTTRVGFARRLVADLPLLREELFGSASPGGLKEIAFGAGDTHRGGQTVAIVHFERSAVVYKPRSMAVDVAFDRLLRWFNATGPTFDLRRLRVLDRGEYGWCEFIPANPCQRAEDLPAFYWRMGVLLSLLYGLHAVDFHAENVIASGAHPVLVDLEALFHTDREPMGLLPPGEDGGDPAAVLFNESVVASGLLPTKMIFNDRQENRPFAVDYSGLSGVGGQLSFTPVSVPEGEGTDQMRFVSRHVEIGDSDNLPRLPDGAPVRLEQFQEDLTAGFVAGYRALMTRKDELLAAGGPIDGFADAPVRLLRRPTFFYGRLLEESLHPDFLRDGLDRERCLARLCRGWENAPHRDVVIRAEIEALLRGDIPMFEVRPNSTDLWLDDGRRLPGVLKRAPLEVVRGRIDGLDDRDLALQLRVIEGSYAGLAMAEGDTHGPGYHAPLAATASTADELLAAASGIADRLSEAALRAGDDLGWLTMNLIDERFWQLTPAGIDSYTGISGIGLFFSYLAGLTGRDDFAELAEGIATQVGRRIVAQRELLPVLLEATGDGGTADPAGWGSVQAGAFGPVTGPIYYLAHAARLLDRPDLLDVPRRDLLPFMSATIDADSFHDVVAGAAGSIFGLLALHEATGDREPLDLARHAANRVIAARQPIGDGFGWINPACPERPLVGFSHGPSGIAVALARLHTVAPDSRYLETIVGALRFEAALYDRETGNWPDRRTEPAREMTAWCHGASGIGLARLDLLRHDFLAPLRAELGRDLRRAVTTTAATGLLGEPNVTGVGNHSLCHGDLGNLELLAATAGTPHGVADPDRIGRVLAGVLRDAGENGWLCGVPFGTQTPGLMTGLAGIGYQLLRFAAPESVPSVLLLQPPPGAVR